jgi:hypothetical protein
MTPIVVLALLAAAAMVIGLFRNRLPWNVVRFGYVLGFATPLSRAPPGLTLASSTLADCADLRSPRMSTV